VGAELQEERAEVVIDAIEVVVVDHRRGADQPRVGLTGFRVAALLGAEDRGLLLGLADEEDTFGPRKACQVVGGDSVFALSLGKGEHLDAVPSGEGVDGLDEGVADGREQGGGGEEVAAVVTKEANDTQFALEFGDVDVEVHAVDAFDFQSDVIAEDSSDSLCYTHGGVMSLGGRMPTNRSNVRTNEARHPFPLALPP